MSNTSTNKLEQLLSSLALTELSNLFTQQGIDDSVLNGPVEPMEVLNLQIQSVYFLTPDSVSAKLSEELKAGKIYKFPFNYSTGLETETAYLLANDEGTFALAGKIQNSVWVDESTSFVPEASDAEEESDDLEFDSL